MMPQEPACAGFTDPEVAEIARFGLVSLQASAAIFYWVEGPAGMADIETEGLNPRFSEHYAAQMINHDPLHVSKMAIGRQRVGQLDQIVGTAAPARDYRSFLNHHGFVDVIDLLFWSFGKPVAGLGLLKRPGDPPVSGNGIDTAFAMQRYVELNLHRHRRIVHRAARDSLTRKFQLTRRENDVAALAAKGRTNAEIAAAPALGQPTVKTHLLNAMGKTGCTNRTQLAAILAESLV
jgi:DNA-binding CsgD family transcriptional regulator